MGAMVVFLFRNLKGYRFLIVVAITMTIAQVGSDILAGFPIKFVTDSIQGRNPPDALNNLIHFFDRFDHNNLPTSIILFSAAALLILSMLSAGLIFTQKFLASLIGQNLTARLRRNLFDHLERLSLDWHGKQKKGDLVQRITGDIANIEKLVIDGLVDLLAGILTLLGVAVVMFLVSPQFTLISLVVLPLLAIVVFAYTAGIKTASKKASKAAGQVANVANEDIGAITVVKAFTLEERESLRFTRYVGKNRQAGLRAGSLQAQFTPFVAVVGAVGTALILGVGAFVAIGNTFTLGPLTIPAKSISVGTLVLFLGYLKMLYQPLRDLSKLTTLATTASAGAERIQEVLDQAPEVLDQVTAYTGPEKLRGYVTFENVAFGYVPGQMILQGINLNIPAGRKVALVGLSGGGKTTLVKLIPRFYEVQWGSVKLDGVDNRLYPLDVLRRNISLVLQDSVLFEGTIRENIAIGKPGATDAEIMVAAQQAHIHETIMRLPDGYNSEVREQGKNFSGGQRQRLAIARAILRDAPILILDEPTASLDVEAEAEVLRALDRLIVGRTVLMISHRLSTLGNVDEIIVLKNGQIVEQGSFKELKRRGGVFAGLLAEQNRYNAEQISEQSIIRPALMKIPALQEPAQAFPQAPIHVGPPAGSARQLVTAATLPQLPFAAASGPAYATQPQSGGVRQPAYQVAAPAAAQILIEVDGRIVGKYRFDKPVLTVGRGANTDIRIPSDRVSRRHAIISWKDGRWFMMDAESLNGLTYQGRRVDGLALNHGDRVYIASKVVLQYEANPA
jgi:ATP-binding cassette subfamily B protein